MIRVREASPIDTEAIVQVTAAGWRAGYPGIVPARHLRDLPIATWRHDIRAGLRSPEGDSFTRIADLDGVVAGYCYVAAPARDEPEGSRVAELVAIYVEPAFWRSGIGSELARAAMAEARARSYEEMVLWTFEDNRRALGFYEALGWRADGARRPHRATGVRTVRLRRRLDPGPEEGGTAK
jgi:ribosomal protein S18 acetylase RimI-like enzyme